MKKPMDSAEEAKDMSYDINLERTDLNNQGKKLIQEARKFPISGAVDREKEYAKIALWCADKIWHCHPGSSFQNAWTQVCNYLEDQSNKDEEVLQAELKLNNQLDE